MAAADSFSARSALRVGGRAYEIVSLDCARGHVRRLAPALLPADPARERAPLRRRARRRGGRRAGRRRPSRARRSSFTPARVLLQDFTGVPAVVDLAAMRNAMRDLGGDPARINPQLPAELVIDHSVQVDEFATRLAISRNAELEFQRNRERYAFLRWGQGASPISRSCRRTPASSTRSTSSTSRGSSRTATAPRSRTRSSAPTRTRRWSTGSACSAGASAGSRPRRRCSASRSRCWCRRSSASS